ncbi:MAG: beta-ketoacyl synthase N-terminal-like domain-containing protein [Terriglobales bacterium]
MSAPPRLRRVVVTGWGALSPGGAGVDALRQWLAKPVTGRPGRVPGFDGATYIRNVRRLRTMHRTFQLATAAAVMAMEAAGMPSEGAVEALGIPPERAGLATALSDISPVTADLLRVLAAVAPELGRAPDGYARFAELGARELHPFRRLALLANMAAGHTSLLLNMQGPGFSFTSGAGAGLQAIAESYWTVAQGRAELMLAQSASSPEQSYTSAQLPEISGAVVLEEAESAARRGAPVLAEISAGQPFAAGAARCPTPAAAGLEPAPELLAALLRLTAGGCVELADLSQTTALLTGARR